MMPPSSSSRDARDEAAPASSATAMVNAIARLSDLLDRETAALRNRQHIDIDEICDRKNQALLELSRLGRGLDEATLHGDLTAALRDLRTKLDANSTALRLHLDAARELADVLTDAMRDADSDGTYCKGASARFAE